MVTIRIRSRVNGVFVLPNTFATQRFDTLVWCLHQRTRGMTSLTKKAEILLRHISDVISIKSMMTHINMPGFQTASLAITIVCGNELKVILRNRVSGVHRISIFVIRPDTVFAGYLKKNPVR